MLNRRIEIAVEVLGSLSYSLKIEKKRDVVYRKI